MIDHFYTRTRASIRICDRVFLFAYMAEVFPSKLVCAFLRDTQRGWGE